MKRFAIYVLLSVLYIPIAFSQTLAEAKAFYLEGNYISALPIFEVEYGKKPTDANLNHWYGACLVETGGNLNKAEECLLLSSKKNIQDSFYYLGLIYTEKYQFTNAQEAFDKYESLLNKKKPRKNSVEAEKKESDIARLEEKRKAMSRLNRMVSNTEDIQIIDSLVVDKGSFLSAYKLSHSSGRIDYFNTVFSANKDVESTVYFNEKETKAYYSQPDRNGVYALYSMEKLLDDFGNEKRLSSTNFGLTGDVNYPYVMTDGVTIYFAAKDVESIGGYDLFVSRYNMNNDNYLTPERLNMPFNSAYNDYMMVIDEEKGIGWFASDRYQPEGKVCIYTFIPNKSVKTIESDDEAFLANRARISSIKDTWIDGTNYSSVIELARKAPKEKVKVVRDFEFVVNDKHTYYTLSDFKNSNAKDTYHRVIQMKAEHISISNKLKVMREEYSKSSPEGKRSMTSDILNLEKQLEKIHSELPRLEVQARNQEIQSL
ncbi:M48 family metallopeptidase [Dysgonomonas sp. Marseille-P4361]|uniref:tetratricopeptide repeat protein n=1 Tax=Dysgonomonas sp. Marseille-P4361 TaxID=2161820 RepID=UPI000D562AAF|nr:tetratricopeptide repeat protein [Dysgonomonas sp. Marseille-P4361]